MSPKRGAFSDYTIVISQKRITFCAFAILGMASGGAYAIRPYTGSQKINAFSRSIMYPVNFPGLGRGLDFLLPSFLVSRQEKKVGAWGQSPQFLYHKINIFGKCDPFSRSIMYPVNFLGLGRGLDFLLPSFLSSRKEKKVGAWGQSPRFLYPKINISPKRGAFSDCMIVISQKRNAFSGNTVGAYCIRPTNVPSMERIT